MEEPNLESLLREALDFIRDHTECKCMANRNAGNCARDRIERKMINAGVWIKKE